jgi:aminoglycoside 6'-N-acetyltransferase I
MTWKDGAMTIRPAQKTDTVSWLRMREALWPSEPGEHARAIDSYFAGRLHEPREVLLACGECGQVVGFIELSIRAYAEGCVTDRVAYIEGWYVEPDSRRQNVGAALVCAAEAWGRSQGCLELGSDAEISNEASAEAHRALGFTETGTIRCFRKSL